MGKRAEQAKGHTPQRQIRCPDDLWDRLKIQAAVRGTTMTELIITAIKEIVGDADSNVLTTSKR